MDDSGSDSDSVDTETIILTKKLSYRFTSPARTVNAKDYSALKTCVKLQHRK